MGNQESLSDQLKRIADERGLTPYSLAKKAGLNVTSVRRWWNGDRGLNLSTVDKLCSALRLHLAPIVESA